MYNKNIGIIRQLLSLSDPILIPVGNPKLSIGCPRKNRPLVHDQNFHSVQNLSIKQGSHKMKENKFLWF